MRTRTSGRVFLVAAALVVAIASPARAQVTGVEVGTSLLSLTVNWGGGSGGNGNTTTSFGIPGASFNFVNPGIYASVFAGSHFAIEPQIGLVLVSSSGSTQHLLNFAGQVDYFLKGSSESSPFVFGSVGVLHISGDSPTPKWFSGGAGYRMMFGDRLAMRVDGRIMHFTDQFGNAFVVSVSLGGVFGQR